MGEPWWAAMMVAPLVGLVVWQVRQFTSYMERRESLEAEDRRLYLRAMQTMSQRLSEMTIAENNEQSDREKKHVELISKVDRLHDDVRRMQPSPSKS